MRTRRLVLLGSNGHSLPHRSGEVEVLVLGVGWFVLRGNSAKGIDLSCHMQIAR
jgi:hypothetical protein